MCNGYHSSLENCTLGCVGSSPTEDVKIKIKIKNYNLGNDL